MLGAECRALCSLHSHLTSVEVGALHLTGGETESSRVPLITELRRAGSGASDPGPAGPEGVSAAARPHPASQHRGEMEGEGGPALTLTPASRRPRPQASPPADSRHTWTVTRPVRAHR